MVGTYELRHLKTIAKSKNNAQVHLFDINENLFYYVPGYIYTDNKPHYISRLNT